MNSKVCIFCGAQSGSSAHIIEQTKELCDLLISNDFDLVYGGGRSGLMGIIANQFLNGGRKVIGVRPKKLIRDEDVLEDLENLIVVDSMAERKSKMVELSDVFIALPGGVGTLDEIIETFTLQKFGYIDKPSGILNTDNYYDGLEILLNNMVDKGFLKASAKSHLVIAPTPRELLTQLNLIKPKTQKK